MIEDQKSALLASLKLLISSPIFNLSLSSKELFHSNFLYWLANTYPEKFGNLFSSLINLQSDKPTIDNIKREKGNIDLSFKYSNGHYVFLENKVKSIPYESQLENYSKKFNKITDKSFILLSLSTPEFFYAKEEKEINESTWYLVTYKTLYSKLTELSLDDSYHKHLLNDYLKLVNALNQIDDICKINSGDSFNFHNNVDLIFKQLTELRMHDFYLKKMYERFAFHIYKSLNHNFKSAELHYEKPLIWKNVENNIYINHGMTRATGLVDIKYMILNGLALGIQIQGEHCRMVIECSKEKSELKENLERVAKELYENKLWFNFGKSFSKEKVYPNGNKNFNKFGAVFKYKSIKLGTDRTIKEITDIIIADLIHISKNIKSIKSIMINGFD